MIQICQKHGALILDCPCCFEMVSSSAIIKSEEKTLQKSLAVAIKNKERYQIEKNEILETLSAIKEKLYLKNPILPKSYIRESYLSDYIFNLSLPLNILTIVYDPEFSLAFLFQKGIIKRNQKCECGKDFCLKKQSKHFFLVCECGNIHHITKNSIWEKYELPPSKIVLLLFLFTINSTTTYISEVINFDKVQTTEIIEKIRLIISNHFLDNLPKFRGVVEIDESCFKSGRDVNNKFIRERWVFGLYERERKLVYMEVVEKRNAKTLIPIIQKRCEIGTTIISDQWNAYNKLAEFGFPHYTVDHSRFFVNPHSREIHTQDIEISWCWAKYNVKKHRGNTSLQKLLHIFSWMRQFKDSKKEAQLAIVLNSIADVLSKYEEKAEKNTV